MSQPVRDAFVRERVTGLEFLPVEIAGVGRGEPEEETPMSDDVIEPEDVMDAVEWEAALEQFGPLYQAVPVAESGPPPGMVVLGRCDVCGWKHIDSYSRYFMLTPEIVPEADVFRCATTLYLLVSDRVERLVQEREFTNVAFKEFPWFGGRSEDPKGGRTLRGGAWRRGCTGRGGTSSTRWMTRSGAAKRSWDSCRR